MFRASRERREDDSWLPAKTVLLVLGAGLGLAGMMLDVGWLITVGIVVLGGGVLLAAAGRRR